jgi:hypothetical protein
VTEGNWVLDCIEKVAKKGAGWFLFGKKWWNSKIFSEKISLKNECRILGCSTFRLSKKGKKCFDQSGVF